MVQFWNLTSDYKVEVFKILNEVSLVLQHEHLSFIAGRISDTSDAKLGVEEFTMLNMIGRASRDETLRNKIGAFFWSYITSSKSNNIEVVDKCVTKFAEMIKFWSLDLKQPLFAELVSFMKANTAVSAIPVLKFFQQVVPDHKDAERVYDRRQQARMAEGKNV